VSRFEYHEPESLAEAIALAERYGAATKLLADPVQKPPRKPQLIGDVQGA